MRLAGRYWAAVLNFWLRVGTPTPRPHSPLQAMEPPAPATGIPPPLNAIPAHPESPLSLPSSMASAVPRQRFTCTSTLPASELPRLRRSRHNSIVFHKDRPGSSREPPITPMARRSPTTSVLWPRRSAILAFSPPTPQSPLCSQTNFRSPPNHPELPSYL